MRALPALSLLSTLATLAVSSGCSSSEAKPEEPSVVAPGWKIQPTVSGSRLRARFITGGGARELVGFHDSQRNEECTFQRAGDGRTRCLPAFAGTVARGTFVDAACQVPAAMIRGCDAGARYVLAYRYDLPADSCGRSPTELRSMGEVAGASYRGGTGACTLQATPSAGTVFRALGEVVPWTDFVAAVEETVPGELVDEKVLVAPDGARQHLGFRLAALGVDCTFQIMSDGLTRCVPAGSKGPVLYADSECSKALFVHDDSPSPGACGATSRRFWRETLNAGSQEAVACDTFRAVYSLGVPSGAAAPDEPGILYSATAIGTGCAWSGRGSNVGSSNRRAVSADLTPSLPTTLRIGSGSERLVPALVRKLVPDAGTASVVPGAMAEEGALVPGWHDNERDVDCSFAVASDGKLRCLPISGSATILFTDTECKSPSRVAVLDGATSCAAPSRFVRTSAGSCPEAARVYGLGTEKRSLTSASIETSPGRCPSFAGVTNAFDATEVEPGQFVEGAALTE